MNNPIRICVLVPVATSQYNDRIMAALAQPELAGAVDAQLLGSRVGQGAGHGSKGKIQLRRGVHHRRVSSTKANHSCAGSWMVGASFGAVPGGRHACPAVSRPPAGRGAARLRASCAPASLTG